MDKIVHFWNKRKAFALAIYTCIYATRIGVCPEERAVPLWNPLAFLSLPTELKVAL